MWIKWIECRLDGSPFDAQPMHDHDQRFKTLLKTFLPEFFALFFADWAETFDFSRVEWLDKEVFPDPPQGERRVLDLVAKLPTRRPVAAQSGKAEAWLSLLHSRWSRRIR